MPTGSPLADFLYGVTGGFREGYEFREGVKKSRREREQEQYEREVAEEKRERERRENEQEDILFREKTGYQYEPAGERRTPVMAPPRITGVDALRRGVGTELRRPPPAPGLGAGFPEAPELRVPPEWMSARPPAAGPLQIPELLRPGPPVQFESSQHPGGYLKVGPSEEERELERADRLRRETGALILASLGGRAGNLTPEQAVVAKEGGYLDDLLRYNQPNPFVYHGREFNTAEEVRRAKDVIEPTRPPQPSVAETRLQAAVDRETLLERMAGAARLEVLEGTNVDAPYLTQFLRGHFPDANPYDISTTVADVLGARDRAQRATRGGTETADQTNEKGLTREQWDAAKTRLQAEGKTVSEIFLEIGQPPEGGSSSAPAARTPAPRDTLKPPRYRENPY